MASILLPLFLPALAGGQSAPSPSSRPAGLEDTAPRILDTSPRIIQPRWHKDSALPPDAAREGQVLEARGRLVPIVGTNWFAVRYEPEANTLPAPQLLLPCQLLEQVEFLAQGHPPPLVKVSGQTTWYHQRSFLLLNEVIVEDAAGAPSGPPPADANAASRTGPESRPVLPTELAGERPSEANSPATAPASAPASGPAGPGLVDPEEILRRLAGQRPGRPVVVTEPPPPTPTLPSVAPPSTLPALSSARGPMVVDRVVQIRAEGDLGWWIASFLGDNTLREPPIRLLPGPLLEQAENDLAASPAKVQFRISGQITPYKGRQYLILRKLLVEKDLGQL